MKTCGRKIAVWSVLIGVLILAGTGFAGRHLAWEYWCLHQLDADEVEREAAVEALLEMKSSRAAVRILELHARSDGFAEWIQRVVEELGPNARGAVPLLAGTLKHRDRKTRVAAARALRHLGAEAEDALPVLIEALGHPEGEIRSCAAETLERIGPGATAAVPALMVALRDPSWQVRDLASMALAAVGPAAIRPLLEALAPDDGGIPDPLIVSTLAAMGSDARSAVAALRNLLRRDEAGLRRRAALALGRIGPPAASGVPALRTALEDPDKHVRVAALEALRRIERASPSSARE